jgi:aminopeptidase N
MIGAGDESSANIILKNFEAMPLSQNKFNLLQSIGDFLGKTKDMNIFKRGVDDIVKFRDAIPEAYKGQTDPYINGILLKGLATKKKEQGLTEHSNYVISKLPDEDKKGF